MSNRGKRAFVTMVAVMVSTACGGSSADPSPTSTALAIDPAAAAVMMTGSVSGVVGSCPTVTFTLERRTIKTTGSTSFGDSKCTDLVNSARVEIGGVVQADGSIWARTVRRIPTTSAPPPAPTLVSVVGTVSGLAGTCPVVSFTLERRVIRTTAATVYGNGACTDITDGIRVEIAGTVQGDGSVVVVKLSMVRPAGTPAPSPTVVLTGAIVEMSGTCPTLRLNVGGRGATTSATTVFDGKPCEELKLGTMVEITGAVASTSTVLVATKVASRK
ncbi:MAG: hypothetical protein IPP90_10800 [Gemmatimonadaceae bacterium]|nr:hypothetical protein [Gemmatimonadaceae bacterium]